MSVSMLMICLAQPSWGVPSARVDVPGKSLSVLGEGLPQVGVMTYRIGAGELEPCCVPPPSPSLLDVGRLRGFEWARSEEVLALCDEGPDVDGCSLTFPIAEVDSGDIRGSGKAADKGIPGVAAECPLMECLSPASVVNGRLTWSSQFCGQSAESPVELDGIASSPHPAPGITAGMEVCLVGCDPEEGCCVVLGPAHGPLDETDGGCSPNDLGRGACATGEMALVPVRLQERRNVLRPVPALDWCSFAVAAANSAESAGHGLGSLLKSLRAGVLMPVEDDSPRCPARRVLEGGEDEVGQELGEIVPGKQVICGH
ncbi:hypothetical protein [Streptomyces chrestomyceticus]|uniref:hypothetical protein n=1 Tax=Streptomyces chrestomyceticus TaxID=68185 RepID=UPI0033ED5573